MYCILNIETSTHVCSVALARGGEVLFERVSFAGLSHATLLGVYCKEAIEYARKEAITIDAVAVSSGPGSYTGLRIGVSEAKGLCFGADLPLISVPTLDVLAYRAITNVADAGGLYCAMLDARRMEVYDAIYTQSMDCVRAVTADIVTPETFAAYQNLPGNIYFFGNGAAKCKEVITAGNAVFLDDLHPLASDMVPLSEKAFAQNQFVDVAYFEPFYLKEFVATVAKNKVLS